MKIISIRYITITSNSVSAPLISSFLAILNGKKIKEYKFAKIIIASKI